MSLIFTEPAMVDPSDMAGFLNPLQDLDGDDWKVAFMEAEAYVLDWMGLKNPPTLQTWTGGNTVADHTYEEVFRWQLIDWKITYRAGWNRKASSNGVIDVPFGVKSAIAKTAHYIWKANSLDNDVENVEGQAIREQGTAVYPLIARYSRRIPVALPDRFCLLKNFPVLEDSVTILTKDSDGAFTVEQNAGNIDYTEGIVDLWECNHEFPED